MTRTQDNSELWVQTNDYDPRLAANEAKRDVAYVAQHHPDVTTDDIQILMESINVLRRLANA